MATNKTAIRSRRTTFGSAITPKPTTDVEKSPNIAHTRAEVTAMQSKWNMLKDCLAGQDKVKSKEDIYLPKPNASDTSAENIARYTSYLLRAVFYNVTKRTLDGLVGQVFSRDPLITVDSRMSGILNDIDGTGISIDQQAKKGLMYNLAYGRFGLLVDYPITDAPVSLADQQAGYIRPTVRQYDPFSIINWRTKMIGAKRVFTLIVLAEVGSANDDGFEVTSRNQWRVLQLIDGVYVMTTYTQDEDTDNFSVVEGPIVPKNANGEALTEIPFFFCGILNNDPIPDAAPLYDLAVLNIAHYRNSADYEDSCYMVGQPTPYFAGLTEQWVNKVFKNKVVQLGSRSAIPLPSGGVAGLLQANPNTMPYEAMNQKERQMVALGAKLIESGGGQNTLGQAQLDESSESSTLATAAKNVSMAYTLALNVAASLFGVNTKCEYSLNTDFPASRLTPNERTQLVLEWQAGAITESEMRAGLRKAGVATLDLEEYRKDLKDNPPPVQVAATNNAGKGGSDNAPKTNKDSQNNGGNQGNT